MFIQFPKTRPALPKRIEEVYSVHYKANREGRTTASSLAQKMEAWMHLEVAKDIANLPDTKKATLEIGAGTLNQLKYEADIGPYDIVEPFKNLYCDSPLLNRIRNIFIDISEIPNLTRYDRITSVATFEHVLNLPEVVARCGLLLNKNGMLRTAIPSEGTFLWTLGWKLTTGLEFKIKYGIDYGLMMRHEHVNNAKEIEGILKYFFMDIDCRVFGLSRTISLYRFYTCSRPRIEQCLKYADQ